MDNIDVRSHFDAAVTEEELTAIRREFHMNPEISGHEFRTMERIVSYMEKWDIPFTKGVAETGVVAYLKGNHPGKTVALRADIDALPITEKNTSAPYCSRNPGVMHACGHDAHTTILLGAAKTLRAMNGDFAGNFIFFFQPDEEDRGGAERMIAEGYLEKPFRADYALALHVSPDLSAGQVALRPGKMYAASDMLELKIIGKSCHGALPQRGVDAIVIAANVLNAMQTIVSRNTDPTDSAVVTFGTIHGGCARNQICEEVELKGIIRTMDADTREFTCQRVREVAEGVAKAMGGRAELNVIHSYRSLITDPAVTGLVESVACRQLGKENVKLAEIQMGCEDFAYFAAACPSAFTQLGCGHEGSAPLHNGGFDIDESCLGIGVRLQVESALRLAAGEI